MKLSSRSTTHPPQGARPRAQAAFTLAEVLAALVFMAIVIPVAIEGLHIAGRAGQSAERRAVAARIGQHVLGEIVATTASGQASQNGTVREGAIDYHWQAKNQTWTRNSVTMQQITVTITYPVQGRDCDVQLVTLVGTSTQ